MPVSKKKRTTAEPTLYRLLDAFPSIALQGPLVLASCLQRNGTRRTHGSWHWQALRASPFAVLTCLSRILKHLCFQFHHPPMYLIFDLDKRRFRMRSPPLFDVRQDPVLFLSQACSSIPCCLLLFWVI